MRRLFALVRRLRRWRRALIRRGAPKYAFDTLEHLRFVSVLRLLLTAAVLLQNPRHFFRRLPRLLKAEKPLYLNPLEFLVAAIPFSLTLVLFYVSVRHPAGGINYWLSQLSRARAILYLGAFAALLPVWVIPLCLIVPAIMRLHEAAMQGDLVDIGNPARPTGKHPWFRIPVAWETYRRLRLGAYLHGLAYCAGVSFLVAEVVGLLGMAVFEILKSLRGGFYPAPLITPLIMLPALVAEISLIRPYVELLRAAGHIPTRLFHACDFEPASLTLEHLRLRNDAAKRHKAFWENEMREGRHQVDYEAIRQELLERVESSADRLAQECRDLDRMVRFQDVQYATTGSAWRRLLAEERRAALVESLPPPVLEELASDEELPRAARPRVTAALASVRDARRRPHD